MGGWAGRLQEALASAAQALLHAMESERTLLRCSISALLLVSPANHTPPAGGSLVPIWGGASR